MKLFIDTSSNERAVVKLDDNVLTRESKIWRSQLVLPMIDELLKKEGKTLKEITEIEIVTGPGSFTGLRVGAAIANALGYALNIPVNGKNISEMETVVLQY